MGCFGYDTFTNGVNSDETIGWQHTQFIKRFYRFLIVKNFFFIEKNLTSESSSRLLKDWRRRRRRRRTDRIHSSLFMAITDAQLLSKAPNIALLQWMLSAECIRSDIIKQKKIVAGGIDWLCTIMLFTPLYCISSLRPLVTMILGTREKKGSLDI